MNKILRRMFCNVSLEWKQYEWDEDGRTHTNVHYYELERCLFKIVPLWLTFYKP